MKLSSLGGMARVALTALAHRLRSEESPPRSRSLFYDKARECGYKE
ncbi:MAG: hypothetical protein ACREQA_21130 [Candidatus Binatia bacterium]